MNTQIDFRASNERFVDEFSAATENWLHEFIDPGNYLRGELRSMRKMDSEGNEFYESEFGRKWHFCIPAEHSYDGISMEMQFAPILKEELDEDVQVPNS